MLGISRPSQTQTGYVSVVPVTTPTTNASGQDTHPLLGPFLDRGIIFQNPRSRRSGWKTRDEYVTEGDSERNVLELTATVGVSKSLEEF